MIPSPAMEAAKRVERKTCTGVPVTFVGDVTMITVYAISEVSDDCPVYVGSTERTLTARIGHHIASARSGGSHRISEWLRAHETGFQVRVLERFAKDTANRHERERYWVAQFDNLLNMTDGGAGASGLPWSDDRRESVAALIRSGAHFNCQQCGKQFWRKRRDIVRGHCKFCSRACYAESLKGVSRPIAEHIRQRGLAALAAARSARTECRAGHPFSAENTRVNKSGARVCRVCARAAKHRYRERLNA